MTVFNSVALGAHGIYTIEENVSNIIKPRDCPLLPNNPGKLIKVPLAQSSKKRDPSSDLGFSPADENERKREKDRDVPTVIISRHFSEGDR